jgi:molybdenum cofactor cytidylyltransferase/nicotine blue oxidoreductase
MVRHRGAVVGVLLAAGAGTRMGRPKALVSDERGSWLLQACVTLRNGGCDDVVVVIGAEAPRARALLGDLPVDVVEAIDWADGMSASLRAGLDHAATGDADAALVQLVDLPDVGPEVVARLIQDASSDALVRAVYDGRPGHPVLIGRDHWDGVAQDAVGDRGARDYLVAHGVLDIECGDLAAGLDVDQPPRRLR